MNKGQRKTRPLVVLAVVLALLAAACDGRGSEDQALVDRGAELYEANCVSCHGGPTGGTISEIPPRHNAEGHTWHHGDCVLTEAIREGPPRRTYVDDDFPTMPAFGDELSDRDIAALLAFIKTWWTEEQREFQEERTAEDC